MSFRYLRVLLSTILGLLAAVPAFAASPLGLPPVTDLADVTLRRQVNRACSDLLEEFPVENTAPECAALHDDCRETLFDQVKAAVAVAVQPCLDANLTPTLRLLCETKVQAQDILGQEKEKIADRLEAACQPLPTPPAAIPNPGDVAKPNDNIVAEADGQGGCTVTGLGGSAGNALWMVLGLLPLLGLRRKA